MLKDAVNRKFDRILVKSVTRFARNSLECIEAIRKLTSCGVSVFFENDNLDTGQMNSEMLIYIKSAFAQQEALSASRRMTTSIRMKMENGLYRIVSAPYGYRAEDGDLIVSQAESENVKKVFDLYLAGMGEYAIVKYMQTHATNGEEWTAKRVSYVLQNERYIGDTLLRKKYTPPVLPLREKINRGQVEKFLYEDSHEAIIPKENFAAAQKIRRKRKEKYFKRVGERQFFQGRLFCKKCGWGYKKCYKGGGVVLEMREKRSDNRKMRRARYFGQRNPDCLCTDVQYPETEW